LTLADPAEACGVRDARCYVASAGAALSQGVIWPPDHTMVPENIIGVTSPMGPVTITIKSIFQDEPVDALGSGLGGQYMWPNNAAGECPARPGAGIYPGGHRTAVRLDRDTRLIPG
jgi:hypothetical protein